MLIGKNSQITKIKNSINILKIKYFNIEKYY